MKKIILLLCVAAMAFTLACSDKQSKPESPDANVTVQTGAEVLLKEQLDLLEGKRVGLITNHSAIVGGEHLIDLLYESGINITALFGPEHGIRGDAAAGEKVENGVDQKTGAPVYSLYGNNLKPGQEMFEEIDILVFDIQDIGARFYTYISTMGYAMQAAGEEGIPFVVLDRPNPLGGHSQEGFVLVPDLESFVGLYPIPVSHGLTVGELAGMIKGEAMLEGLADLDLQIIEMKEWNREMLWPDTGLDWIPPSPNIPTFETALIYPGACFFERTSASEGRGTMQPFMQLGAPWVDGEELAEELNQQTLPGLEFEAASFTPRSIEGMATNPKWEGEQLQGIKYVITDPQKVQPVAAGIHVLKSFYRASIKAGEVDFLKPSLRILAGTERLYEMIESGASAQEIIVSWKEEVQQFEELREPYLLYE